MIGLAGHLANPDLAVLLVVVGALLLYLEFNIPGAVVPGAAGVLAMTLGLYGLSLLPIRPSALLLLVAALALILLELKIATHGLLASAGILALVFGLLRLVDSSDAAIRVHTTTAIGAGVGFGVITFGLAWIALLARRNKTLLGPQAMLGKLAVVRMPLAPAGQVEVSGELWQATLQDPAQALPEGARVLIRQIDGLTLIVEAA